MNSKTKRRLHTIATAVSHLHKAYSLYKGEIVTIDEINKVVMEMLRTDITSGTLQGSIADYTINIVEPKNIKGRLNITITYTA